MNIMKKLSCPSFFLFFIIFLNSVNVISADDHQLQNYQQVMLPGVVGPESIAFDCHGKGPYVGVSDGRILKWQGPPLGWVEFAITSSNRQRKLCDGSTDSRMEPICGRPLGLKFNEKTCQLYIADAYFGLLVVGPNGGQALKLVASAEGVPFRFTNALDIDTNTGHVYFTDTSTVFQRRDYLLAMMGGDKTGRLLKYDPRSKKVTVMHKGLAFPNGVALSKNNSFILVAESTTMQILRFWLHDDQNMTASYTPEVFAQLVRFPDNIKRNHRGEFWLALNSARWMIKKADSVPWFTEDPVGLKFDEMGKVVMMLDGKGGEALESVSEVEEHGGCLYMGSSIKPYVGIIKLNT
ncbi:hypothetical protein Ddye_030722 [Dipteronia dyeriana]|uniref:Strictosidine synthase conserved region domain-containing protein n=1 Tax=Dipteronia dyeriana TaxID=168575 RepID=A0AAD9TGX8_9ROSI|nr:hypothetical protein Ddye_030722 [Dipteronia dyeriana]